MAEPEADMRAARTRIGRVKLNGGAELRLLPSAVEARTAASFAEFERAAAWTRELYAKDFAGFVLIPWTSQGEHNTFVVAAGPYPQINDLPRWVPEALRRDAAERDARCVIDRTFGL
jgi:hypothetical protein